MLTFALGCAVLSMFLVARMFALVVQKNERIEQLEQALKVARDKLAQFDDTKAYTSRR